MSDFVISKPGPSIFKIAVLRESKENLHIALYAAIGFKSKSESSTSGCWTRYCNAFFAGLTLHADAGIRAQAVAVMKRILRGVPRMRNAMLLGVAGLAARIPDDTPEVIQLGTHNQNCMLYLISHQDQRQRCCGAA